MTINLKAGRVPEGRCATDNALGLFGHEHVCHAKHLDEMDVPEPASNRALRRAKGQRSLPRFPHRAGALAAARTGHLPGARPVPGMAALTRGQVEVLWRGDVRLARRAR